MAVLLVGVGNGVCQVRILLDMPLNSMGRDALACVAIGPVDDALTTAVTAKPKQAVVHLGDGVGGSAAQLVERARDALKREVQRSGVRPDLNRVGSKGPDLAEIGNHGHQAVRGGCGLLELQQVNGRAVQKSRDPHLLAVRFVEHKVAIQIGHGHRAGKVGVSDWTKCVCGGVVDEAGAVASNEQLGAVVRHADRASVADVADQRGSVGVVDLEQLGARHHEACAIV